MLDKKTIKGLKKKLEADKKRLEKDLASFTKKNIHNKDDYQTNFPSFGNESDENAKEVASFGDRLTLERTLEKELRDVNNTLKKIDNEKYGVCYNCNQEIPLARLEARPTASTCIKCKQELKSK
ncbi:TraR/DksA family transcriptional regulator [Patescibacteria group bacterium]